MSVSKPNVILLNGMRPNALLMNASKPIVILSKASKLIVILPYVIRLIMKSRKLRTKKFYSLGTREQCYKPFLSVIYGPTLL
jgi:hypothetical protein